MEASAIQAPAVVARPRAPLGGTLLRLRSDEQLVALFRAGHDEAFRVIYDRYRQRLFAYTRQMLAGRQDAEDALQDVFTRAYANLRATDREVALRAWLYRVAHNRCVDELRRPAPPPPEAMQFICSPMQDPIAQADQRESLRRLVSDVRRLPAQQRSALLMRELGGMPYADLAVALGVSVPAVKSLLVRARMALAQAAEARETACADIREELVLAHDRRVRPNANARRHMRDCAGCRQFRGDLRGVSRQLSALVPALGPLGVVAKLVGVGGGAGGGAAASGGAAATGGVAVGAAGTGGAILSAGALTTGATHIATLIAATVVTAGGAVEIQHTISSSPVHHRVAHHHAARASAPPPAVAAPSPPSTPSLAADVVAAPVQPASPPVTASAAATVAPVKAAVKAVKKVSSVVSTTTNDATKDASQTKPHSKIPPAAKTASSTSKPGSATATGSSTSIAPGSSTAGSTTVPSTSTDTTTPPSTPASGPASGSSDPSSSTPSTTSTGTPPADPEMTGTLPSGSGTT